MSRGQGSPPNPSPHLLFTTLPPGVATMMLCTLQCQRRRQAWQGRCHHSSVWWSLPCVVFLSPARPRISYGPGGHKGEIDPTLRPGRRASVHKARRPYNRGMEEAEPKGRCLGVLKALQSQGERMLSRVRARRHRSSLKGNRWSEWSTSRFCLHQWPELGWKDKQPSANIPTHTFVPTLPTSMATTI